MSFTIGGEKMECITNFHGDQITSVRTGDGVVYVPVKRLCEHLGIDHNRQTSKLQKDARFNCRHMSATGNDGKYYKMLCLPLDEIEGWLLSISANKVRPDLRDKLVRYQKECFDVLNAYWTKGAAINPRLMTLDKATIETVVKDAVAKAVAEHFTAEASGIKSRRRLLFQEEAGGYLAGTPTCGRNTRILPRSISESTKTVTMRAGRPQRI